MADVTTTPKTVSYRDEGYLNAGITAAATTVTVGSIFKYPSGVKTKQGFDSTQGFCEITDGARYEIISFGTAAVDATTKVTTLTDVRRGLSQTSTTANFTAGTGLVWDKGARIRVIDYQEYIHNTAFLDKANTFTQNQLLSSTNELQFADSATAIWDDGTNLSFKDSANSTITLSTIAAAAGADQKVGIDTGATAGFIGAASSDGVLRTGTSIGYTDGGDFVTLKAAGLELGTAGELTIATGAVTVTGHYHTLDTEGDASGDDLITITAATGTGDTIFLRLENSARMVNIKDGDGNITIPGGDYTLSDADEILQFSYDGTNWRLIGSRGDKVGDLKIETTATAPTGWVFCDGTAYNASTSAQYQNLFDKIGNTYGGSDNTDFQVPDLRGRFPLGKDNMGGSSADRVTHANADTLGGAEGSETAASHTHTIDPDNTAINRAGGGGDSYGYDSNGTQPTSAATPNAMNPYLTLNYIIKY